MDVSKVTRFEVIDHTPPSVGFGVGGRVFVHDHAHLDLELSLQDDGKTLKVFLKNK